MSIATIRRSQRRLSLVVVGLIAAAGAMGAPSAQAAETCQYRSFHLTSQATTRDVATERGYTGSRYGMLRARTFQEDLGSWEKLTMVCLGNDEVAILGANGRYVSVELGYPTDHRYYGMLRARWTATSIGREQRFKLETGVWGGISLKSVANDRYVTAEADWSGDNWGMLRARAVGKYVWEQFWIHWL